MNRIKDEMRFAILGGYVLEYINPLLKLPADRALLTLPDKQRTALEAMLRELRDQANDEAEKAWLRRKGPMAAYWRAVSTYARHTAHALSNSAHKARQDDSHVQAEKRSSGERHEHA